jgi:hypothetical protein
MADSKISALTVAAALGGTEAIPMVQSAADVRATPADFSIYLAATTQTLTNKTFDSAGSGNSLAINGTAVSAVTGTGAVVLATSPTLVTPVLGVAAATSINKVAFTAPATSATLTLIDGTTVTGPPSTATLAGLGLAQTFTATQTFNAASQSIILGANGGNLGVAKLFGSTSGDVTVKAAAAAGTATVFQLPATNGSNTYVLQTNGSGVTSWVAPSAGGAAEPSAFMMMGA